MELIQLSSYTFEEKMQIAQRHLVPKQLRENGLEGKVIFPTEILEQLINHYTREAGVRNLERRLAGVLRHRVVFLVRQDAPVSAEVYTVQSSDLVEALGPHRFKSEDLAKRSNIPGVVTGLAWTAVGGDVLPVETTLMPGKGKLRLTGTLGDVMKESAEICLSWVKANLHRLPSKFTAEQLDARDLHVHFPAGAVPKDGPSAGVTILTALVSLLTQRPVRSSLAMTGELSLTGAVLPVGGYPPLTPGSKRSC